MTHALKTIAPYFNDIVHGAKTFEVRKADRPFKVGDRLLLQEWDGQAYTGKEWDGSISYLMDDKKFVKPGYVILGIKEAL